MILSDQWYKNAIIYAVELETFQDGNGDGVGDFEGLTHRLDYLAGLGVTCIWLLPFFRSPRRDNGYDVEDYYSVHPRYGSFGHFVEFMREAREHGMRVVIDLVINHTSDQHPWFLSASEGEASPYYDWYVWRKEKPQSPGQSVFPDTEDSVWTYSKTAKAWYLHHFYHFQPDLNIANPRVRHELTRVIGFWLELGVSGFRVDAAPFLIDAINPEGVHLKKAEYQLLSDLRDFIDNRRGDAALLAEANVDPEHLSEYFGNDDRFHLLLNFYLNQYLFLALKRQEREPLLEALRSLPQPPKHAQWANFLRTHDELTLSRLLPEQRAEVMAAFGPDENMQLYGRGIRRRLAPLLGGDQRRIELAYSLVFSLPGTPVLRAGDDIGMGDDLTLHDRNSVRTAMQWTDEPSAGFSNVPPEKLEVPLISTGAYAHTKVNVRAQEPDSGSLLHRVQQMARARRLLPEIGCGKYRPVDLGPPALFSHVIEWAGRTLLALHNMSNKPVTARGVLKEFPGLEFLEVMGCQAPSKITDKIDLGPYEYRWFRAGGGAGIALGY